MTNYVCTWWQVTGRMTPFIAGVSSPIMRSLETGEERSQRDLPTAALYAAPRAYEYAKGADGLTIFCVHSDGHHWCIDGRASNCTMKDDNEHRCWVRHGTVGEKLTVDKNGKTCAAGAGSFFMGNNNEWHGFLRNGELVQA